MAIFRKSENKNKIQIDSSIKGTVDFLNKKFPRLAEVTDDYYNKLEKLQSYSVDANLDIESDPSEKFKINREFLNSYSEEIKEIRTAFDKLSARKVEDINHELKETKRIFKLMENNTQKVRELHLNSSKEEIAQKVKVYLQESEDLERYALHKNINNLIIKLERYKEDDTLILPDSLEQDIKLLNSLIKEKKYKNGSSKELRWFVAFGVASVATITGVMIWLLV